MEYSTESVVQSTESGNFLDKLTDFVISGTPNEDTWPGVTQLPDYKPLPVYQPSLGLAQVVPRLSARGRDLLARLLTCNPALRLPADDAMAHAYFHDLNPSVKNDRC